MDEKVVFFDNNVPLFDETNYFGWKAKMKGYLKKFGVWDIFINASDPSNKKSKSVAKK